MKVSIIIPVYNNERYLSETIISALNQTWGNKEIIVVDNGSTDRSYEIALSFLSQGVKVFQQLVPGSCAARNLGFEKSTGDYIQFLDGDDILDTEKIRSQLALVEDPSTILFGSLFKFQTLVYNAKFINQGINKDYQNPIDFLVDSWNGYGKGQTSLWLCHRDTLEKAGTWDETLDINQDGEYFCRVLLQARRIVYCEASKVFYRTNNENSVSKGKSYRKSESLLRSYISYKEQIFQFENSKRVKHALMKNFLSFIYENYPNYLNLIMIADDNIKELGFRNYESIGGKHFQILQSILGFYGALKFRQKLKLFF